MVWKQVSTVEYCATFGNFPTVFHSSDFNELNAVKVDQIFYLIAELDHCTYGIVFGKIENCLKSPFSAPFGGIIHTGEFNASDLSILGKDLIQWAKNDSSNLHITLPPIYYNESFYRAVIESFKNVGFETNYIDLNAHFDLQANFSFEDNLERNARKNLKNSLKYNYSFSVAKTFEEKLQVYSIIQKNRSEKGFPLRMTFEDLTKTNSVIPIDYFLLKMNSFECAAAIVFTVSASTVMVVYWGNLYAHAEMRPMNLLPKLLFEHYQKLGKQFIDIGPSSENGILNEGLAAFKKSLGCISTDKHSLKFLYE